MLPIQKKYIRYNISKRSQKPIYICVHDTGNSNPGSDALAHYKYFNGGNRGASADFFVDDHQIIQTVDYNVNYSWAVGDGRGRYGISNANSISIELCINSDGNYDQTLQNGIELVAYLAKELGIDHIVRHYDASRKCCPRTMSANSWEKWTSFKSKISDLIDGGGHVTPPEPKKPSESIKQPVTLIRQGNRGPQVSEIQSKLLKLGFDPKGVDGIFGPNTLLAVKAFQASRHIGVDGIVGPITLSELSKPNPVPPPPSPKPVPPPPQPKRYTGRLLKYGCRGDDVKKLQSLLGGLIVDGIFGPKTKAKVIEYQRSHGLGVDGIVGPETGTYIGL